MANVFRHNEISLFDKFYPIIGPVLPQVASQFAPKQQTVGDYTKDSEVIKSTWVMSDQTEGIGIKDMVEAKDAKRCWWSTCELGYKGHLLLPVRATDCGNGAVADAAVIIEFNNEEYVAFGTSVRKWNEGTSAWSANLVTLAGTPTDGIVHKSKLYFAMGTDFERFDGTTWTDGATLAAAAKAARLLVEWDGKLFALDNTGQLRYSSDQGVTWTNSALSTLPSGYFNSLYLHNNVSGVEIIYLGTKVGLFALDFTNAKWVETKLALPFHDDNCKGAIEWRVPAYISSGQSVIQYVVSDPSVATPMGPDRDYGLPTEYRGSIIKLLRGHNALYALLDATSELARDQYLCGDDEYGNLVFYDNEGYSAVLSWNEKGWGVVYLSGAAATPLTAGAVSTADDIYRLWFGIDSKVFYVPLQVNIQNPLEVAGFPFAASGEHITPWFDADNSVIDKLAATVTAYAKKTSATEYIKLSYGIDYNDNTWTLLTNSAFPDGQIDSDGEAEFTLASQAGVVFKAIRFKAELARGGTTTVSPDLRWLRLSYIKLLDIKWGFTVRVDVSRNYRFKTAKSLLSALKTALTTQTLGEFTFKDGNGTETHRVRIADMRGAEIGGRKSLGLYDLQLVAP